MFKAAQGQIPSRLTSLDFEGRTTSPLLSTVTVYHGVGSGTKATTAEFRYITAAR